MFRLPEDSAFCNCIKMGYHSPAPGPAAIGEGVMAGPHSPLGSRRRLGAELRRLRTKTGLTLDDVAEMMTCSTSKISRLETGKGMPKMPGRP